MLSSNPFPLQQQLLRAAVTCAPELTRFLKSQVSDASEAPDLMQDVYVRILCLQSLEAIRSPRAYLFTIAASIAHAHRLRRAALAPHIPWDEAALDGLALSSFEINTPESHALLAERVEDLGRRLEELPPKIHAAILMSHRDGYTYEEIAEKLAVVRNRVKKYLVKGLAHCRGKSAVIGSLA